MLSLIHGIVLVADSTCSNTSSTIRKGSRTLTISWIKDELMLLNYKSKTWWKALRHRNDRNQHSNVGVWLKNNISYYFELVVRGRRIRKGGFNSAEQAAIARDYLIDQLGLPHKRAFCESQYDYLLKKYELIADPGE